MLPVNLNATDNADNGEDNTSWGLLVIRGNIKYNGGYSLKAYYFDPNFDDVTAVPQSLRDLIRDLLLTLSLAKMPGDKNEQLSGAYVIDGAEQLVMGKELKELEVPSREQISKQVKVLEFMTTCSRGLVLYQESQNNQLVISGQNEIYYQGYYVLQLLVTRELNKSEKAFVLRGERLIINKKKSRFSLYFCKLQNNGKRILSESEIRLEKGSALKKYSKERELNNEFIEDELMKKAMVELVIAWKGEIPGGSAFFHTIVEVTGGIHKYINTQYKNNKKILDGLKCESNLKPVPEQWAKETAVARLTVIHSYLQYGIESAAKELPSHPDGYLFEFLAILEECHKALEAANEKEGIGQKIIRVFDNKPDEEKYRYFMEKLCDARVKYIKADESFYAYYPKDNCTYPMIEFYRRSSFISDFNALTYMHRVAMEMEWVRNASRALNDNNNQLRVNIGVLNSIIARLNNRIINAECDDMRRKAIEYEERDAKKENEELRKSNKELKQEVSELNHKNKTLNDEKKSAETQKAKKGQELLIIAEERDNLSMQNNLLQSEKKTLEKTLEAKEISIAEAQEELTNKTRLLKKINDDLVYKTKNLSKKVEDLTNENTKLNKEKDEALAKCNNMKEEILRLKAENAEIQKNRRGKMKPGDASPSSADAANAGHLSDLQHVPFTPHTVSESSLPKARGNAVSTVTGSPKSAPTSQKKRSRGTSGSLLSGFFSSSGGSSPKMRQVDGDEREVKKQH